MGILVSKNPAVSSYGGGLLNPLYLSLLLCGAAEWLFR